MSVKIIYFVHGTTTDNIEHKSTGWNPGELSEKGIQQSRDLKNQINTDDIDFRPVLGGKTDAEKSEAVGDNLTRNHRHTDTINLTEQPWTQSSGPGSSLP